ncbi:MAG: SH3 domain-containing protein [Eubacterium sp.]|nr:SH3 domain-containing protein [Eubacterium sp.]
MNKMKEFFSKMKNDEHRVFEITMFSVSSVVALVVLVCIIMLGNFYLNHSDDITDEEANAGSVTESAITETEQPEAIPTKNPELVVHEDDDSEIDEDLATAEYAYTTTNVNMRAEMNLTADVLDKVPSGTKVKVVKLSDDKEWCEVTYNGQTGYIKALYLSTTKPKPLATLAPTTAPTASSATSAPVATKTPKVKKTKKPKKTKNPYEEEEEETEETEEPVVEETEAPTKAPEATAAPTKAPVATAAPTKAPTKEPVVTEAPNNGEEN